MQNSKNIKQEIVVTTSLGQITKAYEEIYLMKIRKTREAVLKNRNFIDSLLAVFTDVKLVYGGVLLANPKLLKERLAKTSQRQVAVLFSSNKRFSGGVTQKIFGAFFEAIKDGKSDIVIIGKNGLDLFHQQAGSLMYRYFDSLDQPELLPTLREYSTVNLFFGKFLSLIKQVENTETIKETDYTKLKPGTTEKKFIFEPTLESVVGFFEQELFDAFFRQASQESILATLGGSISELEDANNHTEVKLQYLQRRARHYNRLAANRKQLNLMPSIINTPL